MPTPYSESTVTQEVKSNGFDPVTGEHVQTSTVMNSRNPEDSGTEKTKQIIWFIGGLLFSLLAARFLLLLFGANLGNGFANFIYSITNPFVSPFYGIFNKDLQYGSSQFDFESLIAIIVYYALFYGITKLVDLTKKNSV